jgi:hypothetical protein
MAHRLQPTAWDNPLTKPNLPPIGSNISPGRRTNSSRVIHMHRLGVHQPPSGPKTRRCLLISVVSMQGLDCLCQAFPNMVTIQNRRNEQVSLHTLHLSHCYQIYPCQPYQKDDTPLPRHLNSKSSGAVIYIQSRIQSHQASLPEMTRARLRSNKSPTMVSLWSLPTPHPRRRCWTTPSHLPQKCLCGPLKHPKRCGR